MLAMNAAAPIIDANLALVLVAAISALGSIMAAVIAAWAAIQSANNGRSLNSLVPQIAKLEVNTNSMTETIRALAMKEGIEIGAMRGRADATAEGVARAEGLKEGQSQPKRKAPVAAAGEIPIEDVEALKLK